EGFAYQPENRAAVIKDHFEPRAFVQLRKINTAEEYAHNQVHHPIVNWLITQRFKRALSSFQTVRNEPRFSELFLRLRNGHLQRRVRHLIRRKLKPMFRSRQSPILLQTL